MRPAVMLALALIAMPAHAAPRYGDRDTDGTLDELSIAEQDSVTFYFERLQRDGPATRYRHIFRSSKDSHVICGEANTKNEFGGYTGFSVFSVMLRPNGAKAQVVYPAEFDRRSWEPFYDILVRQGCWVRG